MYTYKGIITGKIIRTRGRFAGWSEPTGLANVRHAMFQTRRGYLLIPPYLLTAETKAAIAKIEEANILADAGKEVEPWPTETRPPATSS